MVSFGVCVCLLQRPLWRHYYPNTQVLMYVVDSNDRERITECKDELWRFLEEEELKDAIVLVMANKQDLPNAMTVEEVSQGLGVEKIRDRTICKLFFYMAIVTAYIFIGFPPFNNSVITLDVQGTSATRCDGLFEGLGWVQTTLAQRELKKSVLKSVFKPVKETVATPEGKTSGHTWWSAINSYFMHTSA